VALHARPLDAFVRLARTFCATVTLGYGARSADGKTVIQLLLLAVPAGAEVTLQARGDDAEAALAALVELLLGYRELGELGEVQLEPATLAPALEPPGDDMIKGTPGAPGIGCGRALRLTSAPATSATPTGARDPEHERACARSALTAAAAVTDALCDDDDPFCDIFRAQRTLLEDEAIGHGIDQRLGAGVAAETAVRETFAELAARFEALGAGFAAERHADVADVRDRILEALGAAALVGDDEEGSGGPVVLLLEEATPSRLAALDPARTAAVVSARGGPTSHAAIVARARRLPLVFALAELTAPLADGTPLEVDGGAGTIAILPPEARFAGPGPAPGVATVDDAPATEPTLTADGHRVTLRANLGAPGDLVQARAAGCQGCGLLRTELLFAGRHDAPTVEEQAASYARVARRLAPHPVIVRLFDAGSDKPLPYLPGTPASAEPNPALGLRGLRLLLRHPSVLRDQLAAVARARRETGLDLRAMAPMVRDADDLRRVRALLPVSAALPLGAMIETPAAAVLIASILEQAAFVSIGSNDLAQYTLAADREAADAADHEAFQGLHPAVLRLVAQVARAAREAGIECSLCGELAGDPAAAPLLVGLGVEVLSLSPTSAPAVRAALARRSLEELRALGQRALSARCAGELPALTS